MMARVRREDARRPQDRGDRYPSALYHDRGAWLLEARRKLIYVAAPISLLACELGFEDPAYFSRDFRTRVGMTPSAFRQAAKGG